MFLFSLSNEFLFRPSVDDHIPSLRLIDFGCAIDMTFFKEGQEFRKVSQTVKLY